MRWLMMRFSVNVGLGVWCVLFDLFVTIDLGYFTLYDSPRQIFQKDFTQGESYYVKYSWFIWPNCFAIWDIISVFERKQLQTKKPISKQTTVWQVLSEAEWATRARAGPESLLSVPIRPGEWMVCWEWFMVNGPAQGCPGLRNILFGQFRRWAGTKERGCRRGHLCSLGQLGWLSVVRGDQRD